MAKRRVKRRKTTKRRSTRRTKRGSLNIMRKI